MHITVLTILCITNQESDDTTVLTLGRLEEINIRLIAILDRLYRPVGVVYNFYIVVDETCISRAPRGMLDASANPIKLV